MTMEENLKLERYKMVTERQKYFTDLARDSFASYIKVFTYLCAGAILAPQPNSWYSKL